MKSLLLNKNYNNLIIIIMSLVFQAIDWRYDHISFDEDNNYATEFVIQIFGKTENNENIFVLVKNFKPAFYLLNVDYKKNRLNFSTLKYYSSLIINKPFSNKEFYGFHGPEKQQFIKIQCNNYFKLRKFIKYCQSLDIKTFESNKDPIIQFIHAYNLKPCGWIKINDYFDNSDELLNISQQQTNSHINIVCDASDILYYESDKIQQFIIAAMDIECISSDDGFPQYQRPDDKIVSIATTFSKIGEKECYKKSVILLGNCPPIEGIDIINCKTERDVIINWCKLIQDEDPDILTNWNGFGFDDNYIMNRSKLLHIENNIKLSRILSEVTPFIEKKVVSAQMGNNIMHYYDMRGRVNFDLMKFIRREHNLPTYKLDYVAQYFFRSEVKDIIHNKKSSIITLSNTSEFHKHQYIILVNNDGVTDYDINDGKKYLITHKNETQITINDIIDPEILTLKGKIYCCNVKDDIPPKEIFNKYRSNDPNDMKKLMRYNAQDCNLCNSIINKLNIMINQIGMSNVCLVPLNWIFNRGQSVKVFSIVSKKCKEEGYKIETYKKTKSEEELKEESKVTYEGAIVFPPEPGMYECVFTLDYASLYPSSIICRNISHETYVLDKSMMEKYSDDYTFYPITYQQLEEIDVSKKKKKCVQVNGENLRQYLNMKDRNTNKICYFAKRKDNKPGLIPEVLQTLLQCRKDVRKLQANEKDPFKQSVYNGLQLAYKVTCNSVYGQLGCSREVGPIALMDLAACTTATGREMVLRAKEFAENIYPKIIDSVFSDADDTVSYNKTCDYLLYLLNKYDKENNTIDQLTNKKEFFDKIYDTIKTNLSGYKYNFKVIYGDTDSIMVSMNLIDKKTNKKIHGELMRNIYINIGNLGSYIINKFLPKPENLEYEKILSPFLIISKKRYVGNLYEFNPNKYYQKHMGIVLKRRDNAQIVKYVVGGIVDRLLNTQDIELAKKSALDFTRNSLIDIIDGKFNINMFVVSKSLKAEYKNRNQIAHAVLADRIAKRDPGNAPAPNDRILYVYITVNEDKVKLQGDRIETPQYIIENNIPIDYNFYIKHQLEVPCIQFLELFDKITPYKIFKEAYEYFNRKCANLLNNTKSILSYFETNDEINSNQFSITF